MEEKTFFKKFFYNILNIFSSKKIEKKFKKFKKIKKFKLIRIEEKGLCSFEINSHKFEIISHYSYVSSIRIDGDIFLERNTSIEKRGRLLFFNLKEEGGKFEDDGQYTLSGKAQKYLFYLLRNNGFRDKFDGIDGFKDEDPIYTPEMPLSNFFSQFLYYLISEEDRYYNSEEVEAKLAYFNFNKCSNRGKTLLDYNYIVENKDFFDYIISGEIGDYKRYDCLLSQY